jgi:DNA modification methylase
MMNPNIKQQIPSDTILQGNCIERMASLPSNSIDFLLTDPPYLVNYRDRNGRTIQIDGDGDCLDTIMRYTLARGALDRENEAHDQGALCPR